MVLITTSYWGESKPTNINWGASHCMESQWGNPQENDLQLVGFPYQFTSFQWIFMDFCWAGSPWMLHMKIDEKPRSARKNANCMYPG